MSTAILAIVCLLIGAGIQQWFTVLNEKRRWKREDETRWHDRRLEACEEFLSLAFSIGFSRVIGGIEPSKEEVFRFRAAERRIAMLFKPEFQHAAVKLGKTVQLIVATTSETSSAVRDSFSKALLNGMSEVIMQTRDAIGVELYVPPMEEPEDSKQPEPEGDAT